MGAYHGRNGVIYVGSTTTALAKKTNWSIDAATDKVEITSFGDSNKTYLQGLPDLKGQFSGFWDPNNDSPIFTAASSETATYMLLYPSSTYDDAYWYGQAWLDYSIEVGVDGAVKISGNFVAADAWTRKP